VGHADDTHEHDDGHEHDNDHHGRPLMERLSMQDTRAMATTSVAEPVTTTDWKQMLPVLTGSGVTLRELRLGDAPSLCELLTTEEVARFISPPPTTVDGFERFIHWTHRERAAGRYICFAVVPHGLDTAIGIFQVRQLEPGFAMAEWGFAIGSPFWGTGVFMDAARLTVEFAFEIVGVHRLEARAAVLNGRGNGALAKVGAVKEGVLRRSFVRDGEYLDQALWSIVREEWRQTKAVWGSVIH
jgi:RimJ/RimL family protein N-acetyltransferase